ncbi:MAG: DUF370 domain-containing protein [Clostridia bacterium]|nr:DUF370 domain-containing protein [Clostridia bacterium]
MYLHIGKNCVIRDNSVIGIFNLEKIHQTKEYKYLYDDLKNSNNIIDIANNQKNTLVLTEENRNIKGYISNIGTNTMKKRKI